ncbi:hypothetical protein TNCV_3016541 [Trichonephila clavipes]|nr:hypothetical protein TNCV_3016541 [Trichonephila clavipes]
MRDRERREVYKKNEGVPRSDSQPPGQPIGINVHFTQHPTREQPLSSQSCQKTSKHISHSSQIPSSNQSPSCHQAG